MSGYVHGFRLKNGLHVEVQPPDSSEVPIWELTLPACGQFAGKSPNDTCGPHGNSAIFPFLADIFALAGKVAAPSDAPPQPSACRPPGGLQVPSALRQAERV